MDHLLWGGPDLDAAVETLYDRTGVRAAFGGSHPELGTRNALARLGNRVFLEVIAPDPTLAAGALAARLVALAEPTLVMWAARTTDAAATVALAQAAGYSATVAEGQRTRPDGRVVRWTNVFVTGHGAGTLVPFFIEWRSPGHPADDAVVGLALTSFTIETPQPTRLRAVLDALDVRGKVRTGSRDRLIAAIDAPRGPVTLAGPD